MHLLHLVQTLLQLLLLLEKFPSRMPFLLFKLCGKAFVLDFSSEVVLVDLLGIPSVLHKSDVPPDHVQLSFVLLVESLVISKLFFEKDCVNFTCSFLSVLQLDA